MSEEKAKRKDGYYRAKLRIQEIEEIILYEEESDRFMRPGSAHLYKEHEFDYISSFSIDKEQESMMEVNECLKSSMLELHEQNESLVSKLKWMPLTERLPSVLIDYKLSHGDKIPIRSVPCHITGDGFVDRGVYDFQFKEWVRDYGSGDTLKFKPTHFIEINLPDLP